MFLIPITTSLFSFIFIYFLFRKIKKEIRSFPNFLKNTLLIKRSVNFFFNKEYCKIIGFVSLILFFFFWLKLNLLSAVSFLFGIAFSFLLIYLIITINFFVKIKAVEIAEKELKSFFNIFFQIGIINGLLIISLGILINSLFLFLTSDLKALLAFIFGIFLFPFLIKLTDVFFSKKFLFNYFEDGENNSFLFLSVKIFHYIKDDVKTITNLLGVYLIIIFASINAGLLIFDDQRIISLPLTLATTFLLSSLIAHFFFRFDTIKEFFPLFSKFLILIAFLSLGIFYLILLSFSQTIPSISVNKVFLASFLGFVLFFSIISESFFTKKIYSKNNSNNFILKQMGIYIILAIIVIFSCWLLDYYEATIGFLTFFLISSFLLSINFYDQLFQIKQKRLLVDKEEKGDAFEKKLEVFKLIKKFLNHLLIVLITLIVFYFYIKGLENVEKKITWFLGNQKVFLGFFLGLFSFILFYFYLFLKAKNIFYKIKKKAEKELLFNLSSENNLQNNNNFLYFLKTNEKFIIREIRILFFVSVLLPLFFGFFFGLEILTGFLMSAILFGFFSTFNFPDLCFKVIRKLLKKQFLIILTKDVDFLKDFSKNSLKDDIILTLYSEIIILNAVALLIINFSI